MSFRSDFVAVVAAYSAVIGGIALYVSLLGRKQRLLGEQIAHLRGLLDGGHGGARR